MSTPIPLLLQRLERVAPEFGKQMTQLSDFIDALETFLNDLEGKVQAVVYEEPPSSGIGLEFARAQDGWALFVGHGDNSDGWDRLRNMDIDIKIQAAALFEPLLQRMLTIIEERRQRFEANTKNLTTLLATLGSQSKKEGA